MKGKPRPKTVSTKRERIAELAKQMPGVGLTSLSHHIDLEWMREAYRRTNKKAAPGVDGQTAEDFEGQLEKNLQDLLNRAKDGDAYRAPPVRRVHIPKGRGEMRPIGIPVLGDRVAQRAVVMALEPVYEQDFLECSYGFRPKRSPHQALKVLRNGLMEMGGGYVIEVDIRSYFDTVNHSCLREIYGKRIRDGVLLRLMGKWLKAGVLEGGRLWYPEQGTPQGGVISPMLANIYLHEVLDLWFEETVKPELRGRAFMVRFADDAMLVFSSLEDARRVMTVLPKRFGKYGLTLHPDKTRLTHFRRPRRDARGGGRDGRRPGSFDFLGLTHTWRRSRRGKWVIWQHTARDRLGRALRNMNDFLRRVRHWKAREQHKALLLKVNGHFEYYGVSGNWNALARYRTRVIRLWKYWLSRRSQKGYVTWHRMKAILGHYPIPQPRIRHVMYPT